MAVTTAKEALADDLAAIAGLIGPVARLRAELDAAEPAARRLEAIRYPSAGMLRFDLGAARDACQEVRESLEHMALGIERALEVSA